MAATLTIGRAGLDDATQTLEPDDISISGDQVTISGYMNCSSEADAKVWRQQLLGLADSPDEPVVPVVFADGSFTGYYSVDSVEVHSPDSGAAQAAGSAPFTVALTKVPGFASPLIDSIYTAPLVTNDLGVTGTETFSIIGLPVGAKETSFPTTALAGAALSGTQMTRASADGVVPIIISQIAGSSFDVLPAVVISSWSVPAANYYLGGCSVQVGANLRTMVGRNVDGSLVGAAFDGWRVQNGLVRVSWLSSNNTLQVAHYDGAQWETAKAYTLYQTAPADPIVGLAGFRVLRNTAEQVTIRCAVVWGPGAFLANDRTILDITLRRGDRIAYVVIGHASSGLAAQPGIIRKTAEAATALSAVAPFSAAAGIRATSNDGQGNRYVIMHPRTNTRDLTNGGVTGAITTGSLWGISSEIGGSGATANIDDAASLTLEFLTGGTDRAVISPR
jgi:hypothetical protein